MESLRTKFLDSKFLAVGRVVGEHIIRKVDTHEYRIEPNEFLYHFDFTLSPSKSKAKVSEVIDEIKSLVGKTSLIVNQQRKLVEINPELLEFNFHNVRYSVVVDFPIRTDIKVYNNDWITWRMTVHAYES